MIFNHQTVLAFFAHPDDETLAAGGTLHRLVDSGRSVHVAIANTGVHSRRKEQGLTERKEALARLREDFLQAMTVLGVEEGDTYLGPFSDNEIDAHTLLELIHWLEEIVDEVRPDLIITHHRYCTNIDHQYCHRAAVTATRPGVDTHVGLLSGEVPSSTGYLRPAQWEPNCFVELSEADLDAKIQSMESFQSEARSDPHPRSPEVLRALAKVRGSEGGFSLAEAFMIQRLFA